MVAAFGLHMAPVEDTFPNVYFCLVGIQSQKTWSIVDVLVSIYVCNRHCMDGILEYMISFGVFCPSLRQ